MGGLAAAARSRAFLTPAVVGGARPNRDLAARLESNRGHLRRPVVAATSCDATQIRAIRSDSNPHTHGGFRPSRA